MVKGQCVFFFQGNSLHCHLPYGESSFLLAPGLPPYLGVGMAFDLSSQVYSLSPDAGREKRLVVLFSPPLPFPEKLFSFTFCFGY